MRRKLIELTEAVEREHWQDFVAHQGTESIGPTRDEAEAALKRTSLNATEQAVALAAGYDHLVMSAEIARVIGKLRHTVETVRRRGKVRDCVEQLKKGQLPKVSLTDVKRGRTLTGETLRAKRFLAGYMRPEHWTESTLSLYAPEAEKVLLSKTASPAERYAVSIRLCTSVLLHPKLGPELLAAVVDLLEAARFGVCEHRVAGVVPKGSPKLAARTARKALAALIHGSQGNRRGFSTVLLAQIVYGFQLSLAELQHDWRTIGDLRTMRERFPAELAEYRDTKLKQLLTGDLLEESAWLASKNVRNKFRHVSSGMASKSLPAKAVERASASRHERR